MLGAAVIDCLPTEAEWEYCCRAGTQSTWHFGDDSSKLEDFAWTSRNSNAQAHRVGEKIPNQWGLFDMCGNVWEWCWDRYDELYYGYSDAADPAGPKFGETRVIRGGSFVHRANCRSSARSGILASDSSGNVGFRLVRGLPS